MLGVDMSELMVLTLVHQSKRRLIMLILTRKSGESVRIGEAMVQIKITSGRAKLIIDAPKDVLILRGELDEHEEKGGKQ